MLFVPCCFHGARRGSDDEVMMTKYLRLGLMMMGAALAFGSLTACADDSTASAPITSNPVTTTSLYSASSSAPSSSAAAGSSSADSATQTTGGSSLPATAPRTTAAASGSFVAPSGQALDPKAKRYLQALRDQNVTLLGDEDNGVALSVAIWVCEAQRKNTDPVTTKGYVVALVAPGTNSTQEANAKADKVIKAAEDYYC
jgi:hypothetical protein